MPILSVIARFVFPALVGWIGGDISSIVLAKNVSNKPTAVKSTIFGNFPKYLFIGFGIVVGAWVAKSFLFKKSYRKNY